MELFNKKDTVTIEKFWHDYEEEIGETVMARAMGKYLKGWDDFPQSLWGLIIATSGGFRFHHFAERSWFMSVPGFSSGASPKEKKFFIPRQAISSVELAVEKRWWKKILGSPNPVLIIRCQIDGAEKEVNIEVFSEAGAVADELRKNSISTSGTDEI